MRRTRTTRRVSIATIVALVGVALFLMGADGDMPGLTIAALFTAAGAGAAALVIRQLVELVKGVFPAIDARVSGAAQAFVLAALLYIFSAIALPITGADGVLMAIVSWLACATAAVGIDQTVTRVAARGAE